MSFVSALLHLHLSDNIKFESNIASISKRSIELVNKAG